MKIFDNKSFSLYNANMNELIKKLEVYRLENRISQKKLADKLNIHFTTVNRWFNGISNPNKIQSYHIKKLLDASKFKDTHFKIT